jgi:TonB-linked SusC/RagA family outer membrane protein
MGKSNQKTDWRRQLLNAAACSVMLFSVTIKANATVTSVAANETFQQQDNFKVTGTIVDKEGQPIIGATVKVNGTGTGTITDVNGHFSINAKSGNLIEISSIGFKTQKVSADKRSLNITLEEDNSLLDEVVVLGYGVGQKRQDLSASVGVIADPSSLAVRPVTSTESMLQGQLPGVTVQANGGDPTSTPSIVIRGQGSRNGDNVLWVVDGVPGAPISSLNDIESVVVLKDAASAAIYGATSGAGGVILVTTKKAKEGPVTLSYDGIYGVRTATNLIHGLNAEQEIQMRKTSYANAGLSLPEGWDTTKNPYVGTTRTDWVDEIFRSAFYQRHDVALNTGTKDFSSRISFAYDDDEGTLIQTFNKKTTLRYNGSFNLNKWVTISEDFSWRNSSANGANTSSAENGVYMNAIYMPSSASVYGYNGLYGGTTTEDPAYIAKYGSNYADIHGDAINPVRLLKAATQFNKSNNTWTTTTLQLANIVPGLKFISRFTYNLSSNYYKYFSPKRPEIGKPYLTNSLTESSYRASQWKTENTLTYDNSFGKHTIGALLSTTADKYSLRGLQVDGTDFSDESTALQYLAYAGTTTPTDWMTGPDSNVSLIARGAYSYDDRYFLTASWRRDYAGRLPKDNNHGDFPAFTAAWKVSNESFFPKNTPINLLKIRGSWGRVGNLGSIPYNYKSSLLSKNNWNEASQWGVSQGSTWGTAIFNSTALNEKLTWETSEQFDLGIDLSMFSNRLSLAIDYFNKRTYNLIQTQTMNWPNTIGVSPMYVNLGEVNNKGIEISANWSDKINKDWSYFVNGNFSYLKNKVTDTGINNSDGTPGAWTSDDYFRILNGGIYRTEEGDPINSFYLIKTNGIIKNETQLAEAKKAQPNAQLGDLWFQDFDNNGTIDSNDRQFCGSATPKTTFALSAGFTWKKLSASMMLQGVGGSKAMYVAKAMLLGDVEGNFNRSTEILNAWSPSNTGSNIPRLSKNDPNGNFTTTSDWYLENTSYLRIKNVTISYDLTDQLRKISHFNERKSSLSLYVSGENLATFTDYSGVDPECGGWDALKYPVSRVISLGVKLTY